MPLVPWGCQVPGQYNGMFNHAAPFGIFCSAPSAPSMTVSSCNKEAANVPGQQQLPHGHIKKTKKAMNNKTKTKKCKAVVPSLIDRALLGVGDDVKLKFKVATSRRLCVTSAEYAAVKVPRSMTDSLGKQAAVLHSAVLVFLKTDVESGGGYASSLWPGLLEAAYPELQCSLDWRMVAVLMQCLRNRGNAPDMLNKFVEFSAGSGMLTLQCLVKGLQGCGLDKCFGPWQDNRTPDGLRLWLHELAMTAQGALTWWGTECSSFSAMCKFGSQRSVENAFLGVTTTNDDLDFVHRGNVQMTITSLLVLLSHLLGNACVLEQPLGSVMPLAPPLSTVLHFIGASRETTWHASFGAASAKPLQLISNSSNIMHLKRPKPKGQKSAASVRKGNAGAYTGIKDVLKESQAYTAEFAKAACAAFFEGR